MLVEKKYIVLCWLSQIPWHVGANKFLYDVVRYKYLVFFFGILGIGFWFFGSWYRIYKKWLNISVAQKAHHSDVLIVDLMWSLIGSFYRFYYFGKNYRMAQKSLLWLLFQLYVFGGVVPGKSDIQKLLLFIWVLLIPRRNPIIKFYCIDVLNANLQDSVISYQKVVEYIIGTMLDCIRFSFIYIDLYGDWFVNISGIFLKILPRVKRI